MYIIDIITVTTGAFAAVIDLKTRKIPNWLTLSVAFTGLVGGLLAANMPGLLFSVKGWVIGICLFLIPFLQGYIGGGDVKLMGAIGALMGTGFVLETAILGALWGGVMAVLIILKRKKYHVLKRFGWGLKLFFLTGGMAGKEAMLPVEYNDNQEKLYIPYGAAIFLGVISAYLIDMKLPV